MVKSASGAEASSLLYEDVPRYSWWLKLILGGTVALTLILGFVFLSTDIVGAWVMFGVTLFDALLFRAILPRRFQIFQDRVKIVLGGPLALNIPLSDISEVRSMPGNEAFVYWGLRFVTSTTAVVEIVRKRGLSLMISPSHADIFLEQLNRALNAASD